MTDGHNTAALLKAVSAGRSHQVLLLLDQGVDVNQRDECSQTALIRTVFVENQRQRARLMRLLLRRGAAIDKVDAAGRSALHWAALYGAEPEVEMLLAQAQLQGVDVNAGDMNGETPLYHAVSSGSASTVKHIADVLRKHSLLLDVASYSGITPLMHAVRQGHDICASILLRAGALVGAGAAQTTPTGGARKVALKECLETAERWATRRHSGCKTRMFPTGCSSPSMTSRESSSKSNSSSALNRKSNNTNISASAERALQAIAQGEAGRVGKVRPRFPPILTQPIAQKIKYRENCAAQRRLHVPVDSDDDSIYGSEVSYYTEESFDLTQPENDHDVVAPPMGNIEHTSRWCHRRSDGIVLKSVSQTSSTENNISSDEEIEIPSPRDHPSKGDWPNFQSSRDLPDLYRIYEELHSPSFRKGVTTKNQLDEVVSPSDSGIESPTPHKAKSKIAKVKEQQISELRKMLLKKQTRQAELSFLSSPTDVPTKFTRTTPEGTTETETETSRSIFNPKISVLPRILKKVNETNVSNIKKETSYSSV